MHVVLFEALASDGSMAAKQESWDEPAHPAPFYYVHLCGRP